MSPTTKRIIRVAVPLFSGVGVLLLLLFGPLKLSDTTGEGTVSLVSQAGAVLTVEDLAGQEIEVRQEWLGPNAKSPIVGDQVAWTRPGLFSLFGRLPWWCPVGVGLLTLLALLIQVVRLRVMLLASGLKCNSGICLKAHFVGLFYGNIIPAGQIGGDPIKAWILARTNELRLGSAMAAVVADRVMGLSVLAAMALGALAFGVADQRYGSLLWWVGGMVAVALLGAGLLVSKRARRAVGLGAVSARLTNWNRTASATEALRTLGRNRRLLLAGISLSVVAQGLLIAAAVLVGVALELSQVSLLDYLALVPPATVAASVPASAPGGWGIGEGAFVVLFGGIGVAAEAAFLLSAVPRLAIAVLSLAGLPAAFRLKRD